MARIEWIKHRLENWALWKARDSSGSLGFATQSSFLGEFSGTRYRDSNIPVDEVDASLTDQAIQSLGPERGHLVLTLEAIYLQGLGIKETARRQAKAESTIKAHLEQVDQALALWFRERAAKKKSFTT